MTLSYLYAKFVRRYFIGKAIIRSHIDKTATIASGSNVVETTMGKYSYSGYDCQLIACDIGAFCSISDHVFIGGAEHPLDWVSTSSIFQDVKHSGSVKRFARHKVPDTKRTVIGSDVWIGHGASIKQGVIIGHGAVVGTGAVVTHDVPPYAVVAGVPARIVKYRFDETTIQLLLDSRWWETSDTVIQKAAPYLHNPQQFISILKEARNP